MQRVCLKGNHKASEEVDTDLKQIQEMIDYRFKDLELLKKALIHRSFAHSVGKRAIDSNERLEFLGDAILNLVVTEHLYRSFPEEREGELTQIKSVVVSKAILAKVARKMNLGQYIRLSLSEEQSGGRQRTSIVADAYEALLGAIYLDGGIEPVRKLVTKSILNDLDDIIIVSEEHTNYKSLLLEYIQAREKGYPQYEVCFEEGPDHEKLFTVEVRVGGRKLGEGTGRSKKEAEQKAAKMAMERLEIL